nr:histone H1-like isoform X2 [Megalopta genalis]
MEDKINSENTAVSENPSLGSSPAKKAAKSKAKSQRSKSSHLPTSEMVNAAIKELKDRKGSSLQAIKKYISTTYKIDGDKLAPFIKRYLKTALTSGAVVQTSGKGASGSFKLSINSSTVKAKGQSPRKKPVKRAEVAKMAVKKSVVARSLGKKSAALKKNTKTLSAIKIKSESKTISKGKKIIKGPTARTKAPKPKKVIVRKPGKIGKK